MIPQGIAASIKNQAKNLLTTGQRFTRFDQVRQRHFWSTYRLTPDINGFIESGTFEFFQATEGQMGQGFPFQLTALETNWKGVNRIPDNQNLIVTELGVSCRTAILAQEKDAGGVLPGSYAFADYNLSNYHVAEGQILANASLNITYLTDTIAFGLCTDFAQPSAPWCGNYAPSMPVFTETEGPDPVLILPGDGEPTNADVYRTYASNGLPAPGLRRQLAMPILLQHGEDFRMAVIIDSGRGPFISPYQANGDVTTIGLTYAFDIRVDMWATESFVEKS